MAAVKTTATERIIARRVAAGDYTLAEVAQKYQEGVLLALTAFVNDGIITESRLSEILTQAAADGIIEPGPLEDSDEAPEE